MYRDPITVDDVVSSRMIADPLHKLDCCVISDGGGAMIMTTAERAKDLKQPPVYVLGAAGAQTHWNIGQMPDYTVTAGARRRGGVRPSRSDARRHRHDQVLRQLHDHRAVAARGPRVLHEGRGRRVRAEGHLRRGGKLPLNTDGGGLSSCHPGMRGIFLLIEACGSSVARPARRRCPTASSRWRAARAAGCRPSAPSSSGRSTREPDW